MTGTWSGSWVVRRLEVRLVDDAVEPSRGLGLADLAGLAVRRNPRRAHLIVSRVLGKHAPVDPRVAWAAGRLLGHRVAVSLGAAAPCVRAAAATQALATALRGDLSAALPGLRAIAEDPALPGPRAAAEDTASPGLHAAAADPAQPPLVIGYAETATALGHLVADAFADARYLHSTRRRVPTVPPAGTFDESHSHAAEHLLLPADPTWLQGQAPVVLVDDELTTGRTAAATIRALQAIRPRRHYVVAALLDLRTDADRAELAATAAQLGVQVDVVALAHGHVAVPDDVLDRGLRLVAAHEQLDDEPVPASEGHPVAVWRLDDRWWPAQLPEGGRHGFAASHRGALDQAVSRLADALSLPEGGRVLVLGSEELMYTPLALARCLAERRSGLVHYGSTTRSPVLPVDEPGYAIRTRLVFAAHDDTGVRFVYNVAPGRGGTGYDHVVAVVDRTGDTPRLWGEGGLVPALARVCASLTVVVVPDLVPAAPNDVAPAGAAGTGGTR